MCCCPQAKGWRAQLAGMEEEREQLSQRAAALEARADGISAGEAELEKGRAKLAAREAELRKQVRLNDLDKPGAHLEGLVCDP